MSNIKRIQKEIEMHQLSKFPYQHKDTKLWITAPTHSMYMGHDENNIHFNMLVHDQLCHVTIQYGKWYPFTPPRQVLLNYQTKTYREIKQSIPMSIFHTYSKYLDIDINHIQCCCHSILQQWAPSYGFTNILNEVHEHLCLQKNNVFNLLEIYYGE